LNTDRLAKRLNNSKKRPLLISKNIKTTIEKIYGERKSSYSLANYKIDCNNLSSDLIVNKIVELYEND
jgi:shikimate kinase